MKVQKEVLGQIGLRKFSHVIGFDITTELKALMNDTTRFIMAEALENSFGIDLERDEIFAWSTVEDVINSVRNQYDARVETDRELTEISPEKLEEMRVAAIKKVMPMYGTNVGHGHVWPRPDGSRAKCGGPGICDACSRDAAWVEAAKRGELYEPVATEMKDQDGHPVEVLAPKRELLQGFKEVITAIEQMNCDDLIRLIPSEVEKGVWDHSVADLYLVTKLFLDGHSEDQVIHFFRNSWLMRDKFNRPDYQRKTLDTAKRCAGLPNDEAPKVINRIERADVENFRIGNFAIRDALNQYQHIALKSAIYPGQGTPLGLAYVGLKLNGEAGEFAEHVGKAMRDDGLMPQGATNPADEYGPREHVFSTHDTSFALTHERRDLIIKEIGDVLWYLSAACRELNITLHEAAVVNLQKLCDRTERDALRGSGDKR